MAQTKTLLLRNRSCAERDEEHMGSIDLMARAFLGLSPSERFGATFLAVLALFALVGFLVTSFSGLSMPLMALALGVVLGAPALVLSLLNRSHKHGDDS